jgi:D-3-phosphoglycerate dehydrogenase
LNAKPQPANLANFFVAVTDSPAGSDLDIERSVLAGLRVERVNWQDESTLIAALHTADAVLCMHAHITRNVIIALEHCKAVVRFGTGLDNIDLVAAAEIGLPVLGVHDYCTPEVADHTLALLLAWNRKIVEYHQFVAQRRWNERPQTTGNWGCGLLYRLEGRNLGLLGFGHIGQAVARRALGFGLKVLAYSRQPDRALAERLGVELVGRDELLRRADFVSLHLPLTVETRLCMNAETLGLMKPGAVLINTSRGGLMDEAALLSALRSGSLGGALLDVYQTAPLPIDHPLREQPNVILTPHVAFYSEDSMHELRRRAAETVLEYLTA